MASMAELARQLLGMNGNSVGGVSPDRYMEVMDRSPYGTGVPLEIGYGEQDQMSPLDAAAIVTGGVPVVGDLTGLAADVDMYMRDPESRNIPNYLLTAAGVLPFLPAASQVRQGIKAYHGSPHDFPPVRELEMPDGAVVYQHMDDAVPEGASVIKEHPLGRFDMSKIGSGEGAQAYGRGLYFAEREGTAKSYREALTRNQGNSSPSLFIDGKEAPLESIQDQTIREELQRYIDAWDDDLSLSGKDIDIDEAMDNIIFDAKQERSSRYTTEDEYPEIDQRIREAERLKTSGKLKIVDSGRMYEVNIDAKPDELLDWDIPISQQSKKVQDAVYANRDAVDQRIVDDYFGGDRNNIINDEMTGQKYMSNMDKVNAGMIDGTEYELAERGIKGVRYADAFTRHKTPDKRSMNYVIFDDRLITIAKKYGISIPAAAAMLARMTGEDTSQSYQEAS